MKTFNFIFHNKILFNKFCEPYLEPVLQHPHGRLGSLAAGQVQLGRVRVVVPHVARHDGRKGLQLVHLNDVLELSSAVEERVALGQLDQRRELVLPVVCQW